MRALIVEDHVTTEMMEKNLKNTNLSTLKIKHPEPTDRL